MNEVAGHFADEFAAQELYRAWSCCAVARKPTATRRKSQVCVNAPRCPVNFAAAAITRPGWSRCGERLHSGRSSKRVVVTRRWIPRTCSSVPYSSPALWRVSNWRWTRLLRARESPVRIGASMSRRPRRAHSAAFKAKVALAAVYGDKTLGELAQPAATFACGRHPALHRCWPCRSSHARPPERSARGCTSSAVCRSCETPPAAPHRLTPPR